ncbi:MAG TPA: nucleotide sugar dehydrogenase [Desulfobacterales bacterium]|nr:nucleotide sugar dehydrogenase [Desulfobacterales bacterium]
MVTFESLISREDKIAVVGLGYVGLPLAVNMSKHFDVVGYDFKPERIKELESGHDRTLEVADEDLEKTTISYTSDPETLSSCRLIIVAVPTPIDAYRIPDLNPLRGASSTVGKNLIQGSCVVFESTVYPGVTEDVCLPILEHESGMKAGKDFTVGYSPERINPGDKTHTLENVTKIVSGQDRDTLSLLSRVYGTVVKAGIHQALSIKVAEAAKVIENTQRDLNIALMNELAMIFNRFGIDTSEVLEAAGTKWNFLPFKPGLVGGHCIGVDPYYLTFKAESLGYHPEMILAGRRINDGMGKYIAERAVKMLIGAGKPVRGARIAVMGLTFKEDVPDLRNTKVVDIINELRDYGIEVVVHDPLADAKEAEKFYGIKLREIDEITGVDAVIIAVVHRYYKDIGLAEIVRRCFSGIPIIIDVKAAFSPADLRKENIIYWRL